MTPNPNECRKVLVADDELGVRNLLSALLERQGYTVLLASDGEEAAELFRLHAETVSLLLTDLAMPHKDGLALAREVKAMRPQVPIMFMSGNYGQWSDQVGHFPCLHKPLNCNTLLREVKNLLSPGEQSRTETTPSR